MKKFAFLALSLALMSPILPADAATPSIGAKCSKLNQKVTAAGKSLICLKSGGKLLWKLAATPAKSTPTPTPTPSPTFSEPSIPVKVPAVWKDYTADQVIERASTAINEYFKVKRTPDQEVKVLIQPGADPILFDWITQGATLVAHSFTYPKLNGPFYDVAATDREWLIATYKEAGFTQREIDDRTGGFDAGAPAFGGTRSNTWNLATISRNNLLKTDRIGMAQTPGHEFFHAIQQNLALKGPGVSGTEIPNWFWEGPAMFIGMHAADSIGAINYEKEGRLDMLNRYKNGGPQTKALPLKEVKANDRVTDPYAIGCAATEYLIAQVGVEKFLNIYAELGNFKNFASAFESATEFSLDDFYSHFEADRASLGFAKS